MIREEEVKQKKQTPKARPPARKKPYMPVNTLKAATQGHYAKDLEDGAYRYCPACPSLGSTFGSPLWSLGFSSCPVRASDTLLIKMCPVRASDTLQVMSC